MAIVISALLLALTVGALIDVITISDARVRFMPKLVWILLIIFLSMLGAVLWFVVGREYATTPAPWREYTDRRSEPSNPGPAGATTPPPAPTADGRTTEQQIADLDREIEEWRLRAEVEKRRDQRDPGETTE
jgi:hypothetical protein